MMLGSVVTNVLTGYNESHLSEQVFTINTLPWANNFIPTPIYTIAKMTCNLYNADNP